MNPLADLAHALHDGADPDRLVVLLNKAARPRFHGGDVYSEDWEVPCPAGCGAWLDYQRYLLGSLHGVFVDGGDHISKCGRCGASLETYEPVIPA